MQELHVSIDQAEFVLRCLRGADLFDDPRGATVLCVEPTTLFLLPALDFRGFLERHLDIAAKVQAAAVSRREPS